MAHCEDHATVGTKRQKAIHESIKWDFQIFGNRTLVTGWGDWGSIFSKISPPPHTIINYNIPTSLFVSHIDWYFFLGGGVIW